MSYSERFLKAVEFVLEHETVFAKGHWGNWNHVVSENESGDAGGLTKYGIDQRGHPSEDIAALTKARAIEIYHANYWVPLHADELPVGIGEALFDIKVNGGAGVRWLQETLAHIGFECVVDGKIGPKTIAAARAAGVDAVKALCNRREQYYRAIVAAKPSQQRFLNGWLARSTDLEKFAIEQATA
jgi:lysozyme family protein